MDNGEVSYMRLKNLVCFYYRYAPQGEPSIWIGKNVFNITIEFLESVGIYYPTTRKYDNSLARWFPITVPTHHLAGSAFGSPAHSHSPTRKPLNPGVLPPTFDLNAEVPTLDKTAIPNLQPIPTSSLPLDPFGIDVEGKNTTSQSSRRASIEHESVPILKGKQRMEAAEESSGQHLVSTSQTPASGTPVLEGTVTHRLRADSVSSLHSEQSTNSFKLEYTEKSSRKEDPSVSKSVKIGITTESQKQVQSAHQNIIGEDVNISPGKDLVGKADTGRNNLPLVELDNIL